MSILKGTARQFRLAILTTFLRRIMALFVDMPPAATGGRLRAIRLTLLERKRFFGGYLLAKHDRCALGFPAYCMERLSSWRPVGLSG